MQPLLRRLFLETLLQDVGIGYQCLKTEFVHYSSWGNRLENRVYDGKQKRCLHCATLGFKFSNPCKQVLFFYLESQWQTLNQKQSARYIRNVQENLKLTFKEKCLASLVKAVICSNEPYSRSNRKLLLIGEGDGKDVINYESVQACQRRIVWQCC